MRLRQTWQLLVGIIVVLSACQNESAQNGSILVTPTVEIPEMAAVPTIVSTPSLMTRHDADFVANLPPIVEIVPGFIQPVRLRFPAIIAGELAGFGIQDVYFVAGQITEGGERKILIKKRLRPPLQIEGESPSWTDGVHELVETWSPIGHIFINGEQQGLVTVYSEETRPQRLSIRANLSSVGANEELLASLDFRKDDGALEQITELETGARLALDQNDTLTLMSLYQSVRGTEATDTDLSVDVTVTPEPKLSSIPLAAGNYFAGYVVVNVSGVEKSLVEEFEVVEDEAMATDSFIVDPLTGYSFRLIDGWNEPVFDGLGLVTDSKDGKMRATIIVYPDLQGRSAQSLKSEVLSEFGAIQPLFEDLVEIGDVGALRTVYGYDTLEGERTGVVLTIMRDGNGYVIDIDGPSAQEIDLLNASSEIVESWQFRTDGLENRPGLWQTSEFAGLTMSVRTDHRYENLASGWHRWTDNQNRAFIAMFAAEPEPTSASEGLAHWLDKAQQGVKRFQTSRQYAMVLGGSEWMRTDFAYLDNKGVEIAGFIMVTEIRGSNIYAWAESPTEKFDDFDSQIYLVMLADLVVGLQN